MQEAVLDERRGDAVDVPCRLRRAVEAAGRRTRRAAAAEARLVPAVKADGDSGLLEPILGKYAAAPGALSWRYA